MQDFILDNLQYIAIAIYIIFMALRAIVTKSQNDQQQQDEPQRNQRRHNPDDFDTARRMVEEMIAKKTMQSQKPAPTPYVDDMMFEPEEYESPVDELEEYEPVRSQEQLLKEIKEANTINQESFDYDSKNDLGNYEYEDITDAPITKQSKSFKIKPNKLQEALIMSEILGKPKALRQQHTI